MRDARRSAPEKSLGPAADSKGGTHGATTPGPRAKKRKAGPGSFGPVRIVLKPTSCLHIIPPNRECTYRAVSRPFYYRRVDRRRQLLTSLGIGLVCAIALPLLIFLIHIFFFSSPLPAKR